MSFLVGCSRRRSLDGLCSCSHLSCPWTDFHFPIRICQLEEEEEKGATWMGDCEIVKWTHCDWLCAAEKEEVEEQVAKK